MPTDPHEPPTDRRDEPGRFPWAGAAGHQPVDPDRLAPHSPMPGAPPYPAATEPPPLVGAPIARTPWRRALPAAAVWGVLNVVLVCAVAGPPPSAAAAGALAGMVVVSVLLAASLTWLVARRRAWPWWALLLVTAGLYWVLRAATTAGLA